MQGVACLSKGSHIPEKKDFQGNQSLPALIPFLVSVYVCDRGTLLEPPAPTMPLYAPKALQTQNRNILSLF